MAGCHTDAPPSRQGTLHENDAHIFRDMASLSICARLFRPYAISSNAPSMAHGTWICHPGKSLLILRQMPRESKSLIKCSLTFSCNPPCRTKRDFGGVVLVRCLKQVVQRMSQAHKVCLVSENVILIRFLNVKQRAHRDVRESEHTHGCVLRAVAENKTPCKI